MYIKDSVEKNKKQKNTDNTKEETRKTEHANKTDKPQNQQ